MNIINDRIAYIHIYIHTYIHRQIDNSKYIYMIYWDMKTQIQYIRIHRQTYKQTDRQIDSQSTKPKYKNNLLYTSIIFSTLNTKQNVTPRKKNIKKLPITLQANVVSNLFTMLNVL